MTSKRKIAVIGLKGLPASGGAATVGEEIINQLADEYDFTVFSVSSHAKKELNQNLKFKQIIFSKFGNRGINTFMYYIKSTLYVLFLKKYDLVYLHHSSSGFITPFLRLKYRVVTTFHGVFRTDNAILHNYSKISTYFIVLFQWLNLKFSTKVVSVSELDANFLNRKYNSEVLYIPNGVKIDSLTNNKGNSEQVNYIIFAANRIYNIKGLHVLLKALQKCSLKLKLVVVGNLEHDKNYKNYILKLSKGLDVEFIDKIYEKEILHNYIRGASVFVFPSLSEAMSMMLLEVAALKIPIIASDIESNQSIFNESEVTFFKSNDENSLAEKIIQVTENNTDSSKQKTIKAFQNIDSNHNWVKIAKEYQEVFNEVL